MLEKQLDDLASLGKQSLASRGVSCLLAEKEVKEENDVLKKLITRVSDLEGQIKKQSNLLDNLDVKCKQLLEQNSICFQKWILLLATLRISSVLTKVQHAILQFLIGLIAPIRLPAILICKHARPPGRVPVLQALSL